MAGCIYKIEYNDKRYIGSTVSPIEKRLKQHIFKFKKYKEEGKGNYIYSFEIFAKCDNFEDVNISIIEDNIPNEILQKKEHELIFNTDCVNKKGKKLNISRNERAREYYHNNEEYREKKKAKMREYMANKNYLNGTI